MVLYIIGPWIHMVDRGDVMDRDLQDDAGF
jgi:hypothetical protein